VQTWWTSIIWHQSRLWVSIGQYLYIYIYIERERDSKFQRSLSALKKAQEITPKEASHRASSSSIFVPNLSSRTGHNSCSCKTAWVSYCLHVYLLFSSGCSAYMTERAYSLRFVCIPGLLSVSSASLLRWSHLPKLLAHNWHIEFQHIFCIATFVNIFHNKHACLISGPCTHTNHWSSSSEWAFAHFHCFSSASV
jgi:hypothetical protein